MNASGSPPARRGCKRSLAIWVLVAFALGLFSVVAFLGIKTVSDLKPFQDLVPEINVFGEDMPDSQDTDTSDTTDITDDDKDPVNDAVSTDQNAPVDDDTNEDDGLGDSDITDSLNEDESAPVDETVDAHSNNQDSHGPSDDELEPAPTEEADMNVLNEYVHPILGIALKAYPHYSVGDTSRGISKADPYVFVKLGFCSMRVDVYPVPPNKLTGQTPAEQLMAIYERDYVQAGGSTIEYEVILPPYDVDLEAGPAVRMDFTKMRSDLYLQQLTLMSRHDRYLVAESTIFYDCTEQVNMVEGLAEIYDSVNLTPQEPLCYVGQQPESEPPALKVGCSDPQWGFDGEAALADEGFTDIVLGPVTWSEAAGYMADQNQENWTAPD